MQISFDNKNKDSTASFVDTQSIALTLQESLTLPLT